MCYMDDEIMLSREGEYIMQHSLGLYSFTQVDMYVVH